VVSGLATTASRPRRRAFVDVYRDGNIKRRELVAHVRKGNTNDLPMREVTGRGPVTENGAVVGGGFTKEKNEEGEKSGWLF